MVVFLQHKDYLTNISQFSIYVKNIFEAANLSIFT